MPRLGLCTSTLKHAFVLRTFIVEFYSYSDTTLLVQSLVQSLTQEVYESEDSIVTIKEGNSEKTPQLSKKVQKEMKNWEEKSQKAADIIISTISPDIHQKLTKAKFNNDYLMLTRLRILLQPTGSSEFIRLSK